MFALFTAYALYRINTRSLQEFDFSMHTLELNKSDDRLLVPFMLYVELPDFLDQSHSLFVDLQLLLTQLLPHFRVHNHLVL